ncbi:MAG TPA: hypothetical protein VLC91_15325 [Spongiibacteraceae bacterium]|nr:hypothetical protein [Spongiibacteraceae bacterium]
MLEPQRSQYLRALGIEVYVPRWVLPGAKPSQLCEWDFLPTQASISPALVSIAAEPVTAAIPARQRALPEELRIDVTPRPAAKAVADIASADIASEIGNATAVVAPPKIALSVVVGDGGILIVDDAPATTALRADYLRLLSNILFAVCGRNTQPTLDVFLWPLAKRPQLDQSAEAARETLAAHIQKQIQQYAIHTVLLLGDAAQHWCALDSDNLQCIKSVSALACLRAPELKRTLWNDIRPLAAAR